MTRHSMTKIRKMLEERKNYLETLEADTKARLLKAPTGMLRVSRSRGRTQYYHRLTASDRKGVYIPNAHVDLAAELAQKSYDEKLLRALQNEIKAIDTYIRLSPEEQPEEVYDSLSEARKKMVIPPIETEDMFLERWICQPYEGKAFPADYPEFLTDKGERVRSKSELMYHLNGIFPGDRLILTSETKTNPLNIRQIKAIIRHCLI